MANLVLGPIVTGIRGSIGGTTFSNTQSGPSARLRPRPPRPINIRQRANQQTLQAAAIAWKSLTLGVQGDWNTYGLTVDLVNSLHVTYHPTGQQCYIWHHCVQTQMGISPIRTIRPTADGLPSNPAIHLSIVAHGLYLESSIPDPGATEKIICYAPAPDSPRAWNRQRILAVVTHTGSLAVAQLLYAAYDTPYAAGTKLGVNLPWRFRDADFRIGTLQTFFMPWTRA